LKNVVKEKKIKEKKESTFVSEAAARPFGVADGALTISVVCKHIIVISTKHFFTNTVSERFSFFSCCFQGCTFPSGVFFYLSLFFIPREKV
jgi:hypothetical protein